MKPIKLSLTNFMPFKDEVFDFTRLTPVSLIVGSTDGNDRKANGAGKSTILAAIEYALFEVTRVDGKKSLNDSCIIKYGETKTGVIFEFALGEQIYKIVRTLALSLPKGATLEDVDRRSIKTKATVNLYEQVSNVWVERSEDSKALTNQKIISILGMDHDLFVNTCMFRQHEVSSFATLNSTGRKEIVERILRLDKYDAYASKANIELQQLNEKVISQDNFLSQYLDIETRLEGLNQKIAIIKGRIQAKDLQISTVQSKIEKLRKEQTAHNKAYLQKEALGQQISELAEQVAESRVALNKALKDKEISSLELEEKKTIYNNKREQHNDLKKYPLDVGNLKANATQLQEDGKKAQQQLNEQLINHAKIEEALKQLREEIRQIDTLGVSTCPTCYSSITDTDKSAKTKTRREKIEELKKREEAALQRIKESQDYVDSFRTSYQKTLDEIEEIKDRLHQIEVLKTELTSLFNEGNALKQAISNYQAVADTYEKQIKDYSIKINQKEEEFKALIDVNIAKYEQIGTEIESLNKEMTQFHSEMRELERQKGIVENEHQQITEVNQKIQKIKSELTTINKQRKIYAELVKAFGKQGVQAYILENSASEIEKIANEILEEVTDGNISIQIATTRSTAKQTHQETFDILIRDRFHTNPIEMFSGGETFRIAFAVRIALSLLLAKRAGINITTLYYDEAFQDLDPDGIDKLRQMFTILSKMFPTQIVITHQPDLKSMFDEVIMIAKDKEGSKILQGV